MEQYTDHWDQGTYRCSGCGQELFDGVAKFKSGTAWPSFRKAMPGGITTKPDYSGGMTRTEVLCGKCGLHLGHVFDDGKFCGDAHPEAGSRYCILSEVLEFEPEEEDEEDERE